MLSTQAACQGSLLVRWGELTQKSLLSLSLILPSEVVSITRAPYTLLEMATEKNETEWSWTCWGLPKVNAWEQIGVWD